LLGGKQWCRRLGNGRPEGRKKARARARRAVVAASPGRGAVTLLGLAGIACATPVLAQSDTSTLSAYVALASDYRNRGLSQTDGHGALQVGVDYQHSSGFFLGGWGSNVEYRSETSYDQPRDLEIDYYAGYDWRRADWSVTLTLGRYTYPGAGESYDYNEVTARAGFRDRVFLDVSYTDDFFSRRRSAIGQALGVALPLPGDAELGASLGRFTSESVYGNRYTYWNVGVSKVVGRVSVDLRYYANSYPVEGYLGEPDAEHWVASITYGIVPR
jgi:uncharacterized protein (TIGR02001 family)